MESKIINISSIQTSSVGLDKVTSQVNLSEVFSEKRGAYLNGFNLFAAHYNAIPNFIHEIKINCKSANKWFSESYKSEIKDCYYDKRYFNQNKLAELDDIFYILYDDLIIDFDTNNSTVKFLFRKTDTKKVEAIIRGVRKFKKKAKRKSEIILLVSIPLGVTEKTLAITKPRLNIEDNYNDDFKEIHQTILKRLSKMNDKGLVLLHGKPGTGKTSYIRYLISLLRKNVMQM